MRRKSFSPFYMVWAERYFEVGIHKRVAVGTLPVEALLGQFHLRDAR